MTFVMAPGTPRPRSGSSSILPRVRSSHYYYRGFVSELPAFANVVALCESCHAATEPLTCLGDELKFKTAVQFEQVSFAYLSHKLPAVHELDIAIRAGEFVALVGPSGAGKSTIADLVMGLLVPDSGRITVDGVTLGAERLRSWRKHLGYVAQDTFLFHDTIRENLLWSEPGATDQQLRKALELAAAHEFVARLPGGLDCIVGDRGVLLSHGERQRIALARALVRRPRLLILDEATNSLDSANEEIILRAVERLRSDLTILMITHRMSLARWADQIYVLEGGTVVERGEWAELCARGHSCFRELCEMPSLVPAPAA